MRETPLLTATLLLLLSTALAVFGQEAYTVSLTGEPADCVQSLKGGGRYPAGAQVTIEARPTTNCRFIGWVIKGMAFNYTSANPFFFYIERDFEAKAVFERLYTGPEGEVIERAVINPVLNISLPRELAPQPLISKPGENIRYVFTPEIVLAEKKYVFLYAEALGNRYDSPEVTIQTPPGETNITAYYYTYIKYLNEYYPLDQFTEVKAEHIQVSENERKTPVSYTVAGTTFPIDQPIPRQLLSLAKINYQTQYRLTVIVEGAEAAVNINGQTVAVAGRYQTWVDAGATITFSCPTQLERHVLKTADSYGLQLSSECFGAGTVNSFAVILLTYRPIPNAEFLDMPAGNLLYMMAEIGRAVTGLEGFPSLLMGLTVTATPPAAVAAGAAVARKASIPRLARGGRAREGALQPLLLLATAREQEAADEEAFRASGRIVIPPELRETLSAPRNTETIQRPDETELLQELAQEAEEAVSRVLEGGKATVQPYQIGFAYWDEERFEKFREALLEKRVKIGGETGYMGLDRYGHTIYQLLEDGYTTVVIRSWDIYLGTALAAEACRRAGKKPQVLDPPYESKPKKLAENIKKNTGGADAVIFVNPGPESEKAITQAVLHTGKVHLIVSDAPLLKPGVDIPELADEDYVPVAMALAAREKILHRLTLPLIWYLSKLSSLEGYRTVEKAVKYLGELDEDADIEQALRAFFVNEIHQVFTQAELDLLAQTNTVEQLRTAYMALVRQVEPGSDPVQRFKRFHDRLRRLGMVVEE